MKNRVPGSLLLFVLLGALLIACTSQETGTLQFRANGEDFVRQGFVSKDGWNVSFDQVLVTVDDVTAYQTEPPFDPFVDEQIDAATRVELGGPFTLDLAEGGPDADTILVGEIADAPAGQYNAISWRMAPGNSGYPLVITGSAEKDGRVVEFTVNLEDVVAYSCGDFIGDVRKGILAAGGIADLEMTFHFDHIFGDADAPADNELNMGALGFDPFAAAAQGDVLEIDLAGLRNALSPEDYQKLFDVLPSLGHVGEGHCRETAR